MKRGGNRIRAKEMWSRNIKKGKGERREKESMEKEGGRGEDKGANMKEKRVYYGS